MVCLTFKKSALLKSYCSRFPTDQVVLKPIHNCRGSSIKRKEQKAHISDTLVKVARFYGLPVETVAEQTYENALKKYPGAVNEAVERLKLNFLG